MISVSEAKAIIAKNVTLLPPVNINLTKAAGHILSKDVFASIDIPPFEQSSMDGYAIAFRDKDSALIVRGEMAAGATANIMVHFGEAVRIFTGARLPEDADTVVMQEKVLIEPGKIIINDAQLKQGNNVRNRGSEVKAGSLAIQQGSYLSPAAIGFLAGIGLREVEVYPMPSVAIIVTGNELQEPGKPLSAGQVYESNSFSLSAALEQAGVRDIKLFKADDDVSMLKNTLELALKNSDVILLTGGVSVGDYDFVVEAAGLCHVQQIFHKIKQKPGKPLYFGMKGAKPVFGLPGNPASVLSCFYNYVLPALELMSGKKNSVKIVPAVLHKNYSKPKGLTHFLKGFYENGYVTLLSAQESFRLSSFSQANCLVCLEEHRLEYAAGETADVYLLPGQY